MKVLIAGGSGLVGRCLAELCIERGIDYVATYNSRKCENGVLMSFVSDEETGAFLDSYKPTIVINAIVQRQTDICEKNWGEIQELNINIADRIARACISRRIFFIHISTDYIFDGHNAPYNIDASPNPLNNYGISKLIAELRVRAACGTAAAIVRVPVLYTDKVQNLEESAVSLIGKKVMNSIVKSFEDGISIRRPVYIPDFCRYLLDLAATGVGGTFHFYNPVSKTTKYEMVKIISKVLGKSSSHVLPVDPTACVGANRPYDTELKSPIPIKYFTPIETGIEKTFARFSHPSPRSMLPKTFFHMFDLDGTLVDSDRLHYIAYRDACQNIGITLNWESYEIATHTGTLDELLLQLGVTDIDQLKKQKHLVFSSIPHMCFMPGAEAYLSKLLSMNQNLVVVTNTSSACVEIIKHRLPLLANVTQWITRGDYDAPKPAQDCYKLAMERYYRGEPFKLGYENTVAGVKAIKNSADIVYIITQADSYSYKALLHEDYYFMSDFEYIC